jgi:N-acetylmuramoyl-L-alanine amidase
LKKYQLKYSENLRGEKMKLESMLLTPNKYSRPQVKLKEVRGIVIHYVANTNSSAIANRNFFENRKYGKTDFGSAHFIVGLKGDIIQCLPEDEMAYHVGSSKPYLPDAIKRLGSNPNATTIGIEMTHIDDKGTPNGEIYNSTLELCVYLLEKYNLNANDLWLHKEVVGWKNCHKWFVDNPIEWDKFKWKIREMHVK